MPQLIKIIIATLLLTILQQATANTLIFAHRASSGLWIQNSRNAVEQTVALYQQGGGQFDGIEVDIVLTKDAIPVLSHDPWVHTRLCKRNGQLTLPKTLIKNLNFDELQQQYHCGDVSDTDFPSAVTKGESIMGFEAFLSMVKAAPQLAVYLDIKVQTPLTRPIEDYAEAIFYYWQRLEMQNPLYIEGPNAQAIRAYERHANTAFTSVLSYPPFWAEDNPIKTGLIATIKAFFFPRSALKQAIRAEADAIAAPTPVANKRLRKALQKNGKQLFVFTPNDRKAVRKACRAQVNAIISDYPKLGPCKHKTN